MNYARLSYQYRYPLTNSNNSKYIWDKDGNIGDCFQSFAVENIYQKLGIDKNSLLHINRDDLPFYNGERALLPMQGWFGCVSGCFALPWTSYIHPVFVGFHLNTGENARQKFIDKNVPKLMQAYQPIGCRDRNTAGFLKSIGIDSYFSGCLTLTFPEREKSPVNGKTFLVDLPAESLKIIPVEVLKSAEKVTHVYKFKEYPITEEEALDFEKEALRVFHRYRDEASLIITSRIHCAMPCIAMGIPVIFIHNHAEDVRFDVLRNIIPIYSPKSPRKINWHPQKADIARLKKAIINNAMFQIWKNASKCGLAIKASFKIEDEYRIRKELIQAAFCKKSLKFILNFGRYWLFSKLFRGKKRRKYQRKYQEAKYYI